MFCTDSRTFEYFLCCFLMWDRTNVPFSFWPCVEVKHQQSTTPRSSVSTKQLRYIWLNSHEVCCNSLNPWVLLLKQPAWGHVVNPTSENHCQKLHSLPSLSLIPLKKNDACSEAFVLSLRFFLWVFGRKLKKSSLSSFVGYWMRNKRFVDGIVNISSWYDEQDKI